MAVRGRKPKPTALKVLEGNPGHRPLNKKEPMPKGRLPRCPDWLEDDAKKEWKRLGKVLAEMGMLTHLDMMAFAGYCQAYARWKGAEEFITQHGDMVRTPNGYLQQVPQVSIAQTNPQDHAEILRAVRPDSVCPEPHDRGKKRGRNRNG